MTDSTLARHFPKAEQFSHFTSYEDAMAPTEAPTSTTTTLPPLTRSTTLPATVRGTVATHRTLLAPEDAFYQGSPPRKQSAAVNKLQKELRMTNGENGEAPRLPRRDRHKDRNASGSRRRKGARPWSKLLWVKQSCRFNSIFR